MICKATDRFFETELDDGLVIMDVNNGEFHALKNTGLAVWKLIDGARTEGDIVDILCATYDVDPQACAREVDDFISQIAGAGFVNRD